MTGKELSDRLERWIKLHGLGQRRVALGLFGSVAGIRNLRKVGQPTERTIARVFDFMAKGPSDDLKPLPLGGPRADGLPPGPNNPRTRKPYQPRPPQMHASETAYRRANLLRTRGIMASNRRRAEARIAAGLPAGSATVAVKLTQLKIEQERAEEARRKDPFEQAKLALQRTGRAVYSLKIYGGPADLFIVSGYGREPQTRADILELARKHGRWAA